MTSWSVYFWPGTDTLYNKLGVTDPAQLDMIERSLVTLRAREGAPIGDFDHAHLQAIHHHLFQDVYKWAGKLRTVDMRKERPSFTRCDDIKTELAAVHARLQDRDYLADLDPDRFAHGAAVVIGRINVIHPFREGNGRTQMEYLRQLGERAGVPLDLTRIEPARWLEASRDSANGLYRAMADQITKAADTERDREVIDAFERFGSEAAHDRTRTIDRDR